MDNFTFLNPTKVIFGKDVISRIGPAIKERGHKNILLIAGQGSIKKNGVYDAVAKSLQSQGIAFTEVWGVRPNPVLAKVRETIQIAKDNKAEAILAVGGGSVIDSAKAVAAGVYLKNIWDAFEDKARIEKALPLYTVLTVSGAASEMNPWAVVTNEEEKKKWSIGAPSLFPVISVIDPSVQMSLPWHQTVFGAIDGLAHIMENYFMGRDQEATMGICESLMRTIITMVDIIQHSPNDYNARANLVWAITCAHNGMTAVAMRGGDWASHGIQHGISALHPEIAHGAGLAVVFPAWILYVRRSNPELFKRWSKNVMQSRFIEDAVSKFRTKLSKWKAPVFLKDLGVKQAEIKDIAQNADLQGPLGHLKKLALKDIEAVLKIAAG